MYAQHADKIHLIAAFVASKVNFFLETTAVFKNFKKF